MVGILVRAEGDVGEAGVGLISHQEGVLVLQDHHFEWLSLTLGVFSAVPVAWGWSGSGGGTNPGWGALGSGVEGGLEGEGSFQGLRGCHVCLWGTGEGQEARGGHTVRAVHGN